ncbi:unnamed protein product [Mycetohabitans rhizoxinica HKI 454]|uniref:Uncharacterized protein n=1 Tax=Mycetohabitans rhizoxinica (strain DSM 19002 / CIP 109453 / HKI 454) TaxID=882378 RepID=E5AN94_MYCRK|nr:unnamed protein product [Mycetohabitans rhizoxinica HKI 454]
MQPQPQLFIGMLERRAGAFERLPHGALRGALSGA